MSKYFPDIFTEHADGGQHWAGVQKKGLKSALFSKKGALKKSFICRVQLSGLIMCVS